MKLIIPELPFDLLPTDKEDRARTVLAWEPIVSQVPIGGELLLCKFNKGETITELRLGEKDGRPVVYITKITECGDTAISVGAMPSEQSTEGDL